MSLHAPVQGVVFHRLPVRPVRHRLFRVLATDQRITNKDKDGKIEVKTFANVTFEVTPKIAEKIGMV